MRAVITNPSLQGFANVLCTTRQLPVLHFLIKDTITHKAVFWRLSPVS